MTEKKPGSFPEPDWKPTVTPTPFREGNVGQEGKRFPQPLPIWRWIDSAKNAFRSQKKRGK